MAKIRPEKFPEWAVQLVQSEVNKEFNRYEPPQAKKDIGWEVGEVPPRQWVNYLSYLTNKWLEYFDDNIHKPTIYTNEAALPNVATSKGLMVYVEDKNCLVFSNGTNWQKLTSKNL